jgi:hypothetical protein
MAKSKTEWVVVGGADGELAHCTRCGQALRVNMPQPLEIVVACGNAFVKMHSRCEAGNYIAPVPKNVREWREGRDTGVSSQTIYSVFMGERPPTYGADVPQDPEDFGRCYRLLSIAPDWRKNLHKVAEKYPEWGPLVREWDVLTAQYEYELKNGSKPDYKLYHQMQELIAEGEAQASSGRDPQHASPEEGNA